MLINRRAATFRASRALYARCFYNLEPIRVALAIRKFKRAEEKWRDNNPSHPDSWTPNEEFYYIARNWAWHDRGTAEAKGRAIARAKRLPDDGIPF